MLISIIEILFEIWCEIDKERTQLLQWSGSMVTILITEIDTVEHHPFNTFIRHVSKNAAPNFGDNLVSNLNQFLNFFDAWKQK